MRALCCGEVWTFLDLGSIYLRSSASAQKQLRYRAALGLPAPPIHLFPVPRSNPRRATSHAAPRATRGCDAVPQDGWRARQLGGHDRNSRLRRVLHRRPDREAELLCRRDRDGMGAYDAPLARLSRTGRARGLRSESRNPPEIWRLLPTATLGSAGSSGLHTRARSCV
jgi:hypothetical protein